VAARAAALAARDAPAAGAVPPPGPARAAAREARLVKRFEIAGGALVATESEGRAHPPLRRP